MNIKEARRMINEKRTVHSKFLFLIILVTGIFIIYIINSYSFNESDSRRNISKQLNKIKNTPTFVQVATSENDGVIYMYNSSGEMFTQDKDSINTELIRKDNIGYSFNTKTGNMNKGEDIEVITILKNAVDNCKYIKQYGKNTYLIELKGDDIKIIYKSSSEKFRLGMYNEIIKYWEKAKNKEPQININIFNDDNGILKSAALSYYIDNVNYTNWQIIGYDITDDWKIPNGFYELDSEKDKDGKQFKELYLELMKDINKVINNLAEKRGLNNK